MFGIAETHDNISHPHAIKILNNFQGFTKISLRQMEDNEWITLDGQEWALTQKGFEEASTMFDKKEVNN